MSVARICHAAGHTVIFRRENGGKKLRKVGLPEELALLDQRFRSRVKSTSRRPARIHHVTSGILLSAKITKTCSFLHAKKNQQPNKKSKTDGKNGKGSIVMVRIVKKLVCMSQDGDSSSQSSMKSILKKGRRSSRTDLRLRCSRVAVRFMNVQEKNGPSLGGTEPSHPHKRSFFAPKCEDRCQEETNTRGMGSQRSLAFGKTSVQTPRNP